MPESEEVEVSPDDVKGEDAPPPLIGGDYEGFAKVIAHGEDRDTAIARMRNALNEIVVEGIKTNTPLHQEIFQHAAFRAGGTDIHYLERRLGLK